MADRRTTPKSRGKAPATGAPSERPKDLPENFPSEFTWEVLQKGKMVLLEIIDQGCMGNCWTISYNRMIGAHLYIHDKVRKPVELSAKHLYAHVKEKWPNGFLRNTRALKIFLKEEGLIRSEDCKCIVTKGVENTIACDKIKDKKVFKILKLNTVEGKEVDEKDIICLLKTRRPIAVEIEVDNEYKYKYVDIYYGPPKKKNIGTQNHIVLLTKYATNDDEISYFKFQNTWGSKWGENGYGKLVRKISLPKGSPSLIKSYVYPELLDQIIDV